MAKYKAIMVGQKGIRYLKAEIPEQGHKWNWRFIGKEKVPVNLLTRLEPGVELNDQDTEQIAPEKQCLFCGAYSTWSRIVNVQTVYLCEEHYYSESLGKIAQKLREVDDERTRQEEEKVLANAES